MPQFEPDEPERYVPHVLGPDDLGSRVTRWPSELGDVDRDRSFAKSNQHLSKVHDPAEDVVGASTVGMQPEPVNVAFQARLCREHSLHELPGQILTRVVAGAAVGKAANDHAR